MARRTKKGQAETPVLPALKDDDDMARTIEFRERVIKAEKELEAAEANLVEAKETYDAAKGRLKDAQAEMRKITREEANPENYPLIREVEKKARTRAKESIVAAKGKLEEAGPDWRRVQVTDIGISEYAADTLKDGGLGNVGALCDYVDGGGQLKNIKGLGDAEVRMIEQALSQLAAKLKAEQQPEGPKTQAGGEPLAKVEGIKPIFVKCLEQKGGITTVEQALAHIEQHGSLHTIEGISERAAGQIAKAIQQHKSNTPLTALSELDEKARESLEAAGLRTVEAVEEYLRSGKGLEAIPGINSPQNAKPIREAIYLLRGHEGTITPRVEETALWEVGGISVHLRTCLERAGLSTVEAVQRYDAEGKKLSDIDGISTGEAIAIMGAIDEFTGQGKSGKTKKPRAKAAAKKTRPAASAG